MQPETFTVYNRELFKRKMLNWVCRFSIFCFLDNSGFEGPDAFRNLVAVKRSDNGSQIILHSGEQPFDALYRFQQENKQWLFGHLSYELNTELADKKSFQVEFPQGFFFVPDILLELHDDVVTILIGDEEGKCLIEQIEACEGIEDGLNLSPPIESVYSRETYLDKLQQIQAHIRRGDCYELNFCQEFFGKAYFNPAELYFTLNKISPNPFSAFYRFNEQYCMCASPERFISKSTDVIVSQPIKGTAPRFKEKHLDEMSKSTLEKSHKDKSENVMVVDMVRNDLSRVCVAGSVEVPSLFSVKSFKGVHQMISTVMGRLCEDKTFADVLKVCFPMGSMTGAPKKRVMELTNIYELSGRGLYSGCIGYITPDEDMDFNVVIRSLLYDDKKGLFSFHAGGGITHYSDPEKEYEESLLKTKAIRRVMGE